MSYRDKEKTRIVPLRDPLFGDAGGGLFAGAPREFVLKDRSLNLHEEIRTAALDYFQRNGISWWKDDGQRQLPTGHLLSSQVACVNHLFPFRDNAKAATALLKALDPEIEAAAIVDDGYVEFEFIGDRQHLKERSFTRGAHCTSVDATMIGHLNNGARRIFLIEWKYTEEYPSKDCYIDKRAAVYDALIEAPDSPFKPIDPKAFYYEPFYQLMRQTLLAQQLAKYGDHGCSSYLHVHVCPTANADFHDNVTAPDLNGVTVVEAWRNTLKDPALFVSATPEGLIGPALEHASAEWREHMRQRYWPS